MRRRLSAISHRHESRLDRRGWLSIGVVVAREVGAFLATDQSHRRHPSTRNTKRGLSNCCDVVSRIEIVPAVNFTRPPKVHAICGRGRCSLCFRAGAESGSLGPLRSLDYALRRAFHN
jgi:hypothetical protein